MDWMDEVRGRLRRGNQILFPKDSAYLQGLAALFQGESHRVMVLWALGFAEESVGQLAERYPDDPRPREALEAARDWAAGKVKMRYAQRKILDCHGFAKEIADRADIAACHAVGQACAVVHTRGHAMGYPMYDLTSIVLRQGVENCREAVEARVGNYIEKLDFRRRQIACDRGEWADFIPE